ncbi:MAG: hypothetical protein M3O34_15045 [Chloroflexota bacterium]|nr:hypothetical protein [Chloroflexota bacterium]
MIWNISRTSSRASRPPRLPWLVLVGALCDALTSRAGLTWAEAGPDNEPVGSARVLDRIEVTCLETIGPADLLPRLPRPIEISLPTERGAVVERED